MYGFTSGHGWSFGDLLLLLWVVINWLKVERIYLHSPKWSYWNTTSSLLAVDPSSVNAKFRQLAGQYASLNGKFTATQLNSLRLNTKYLQSVKIKSYESHACYRKMAFYLFIIIISIKIIFLIITCRLITNDLRSSQTCDSFMCLLNYKKKYY